MGKEREREGCEWGKKGKVVKEKDKSVIREGYEIVKGSICEVRERDKRGI